MAKLTINITTAATARTGTAITYADTSFKAALDYIEFFWVYAVYNNQADPIATTWGGTADIAKSYVAAI